MVGRGFEVTLVGSTSSEAGVESRHCAIWLLRGALRTYLRLTLGSPSGVWAGVVFGFGSGDINGGEDA